MHSRYKHVRSRVAFTLVELLIVIGIIGMLISILMPALGRAHEASRTVACLSNLRQIGIAATSYASENRGYTVPGYADYSTRSGNNIPVDAENFATVLVNGGYLYAPTVGNINDGPSSHASPFFCPAGMTDQVAIHLQPGVSAPFPQTRQAGLAQQPWRVQSRASGIIIDSWYGVNAARDGYTNHPFPCRRLPDDGNHNRYELPKVTQIPQPANMVFLFDGTFLATYYEPTRIAARHNYRTYTNLLFFDGHAASVATAELPGGLDPQKPNPFADVTLLKNYPMILWRLDQN